jgi:cell division protein FtsW
MNQNAAIKIPQNENSVPVLYDRYLLLVTLALLSIGLLMLASASIPVSDHFYHNPFHFLLRQVSCLFLGLILAAVTLRLELSVWQRFGGILLIVSIVLLSIVLIHGVGRQINGSMRWIGVGPVGLQVSEFAKLAVIIYMAGYLVRHEEAVRASASGFLRPLLILGIIGFLLLKEPDFGATTVILVTALGMMFLAGARLWQFLVLFLFVVAGLFFLALSSPYRLLRLTTFLNPWANPFDSGYQLTQSLIAFGRGGWFGVGLGESIQKLFYLPDAHTDFLFAVTAEELGLVGAIFIILLFILFIGRIFKIGRYAEHQERLFAAYLAYGIGVWIAVQAMINMGVNIGLLPTKGLTLPLMSYGGSSMMATCVAIALLFRIDYEARLLKTGHRPSKSKHQKMSVRKVRYTS